jgi:hypothetical protein
MKRTDNIIGMEAPVSPQLLNFLMAVLLRSGQIPQPELSSEPNTSLLALFSQLLIQSLPSGAGYYRQFTQDALQAESKGQDAEDNSDLPDLESDSGSEVQDPWDPDLITSSENSKTSSDSEFGDLPELETDSEFDGKPYDLPELVSDSEDDFELIESELAPEIKQQSPGRASQFNRSSDDSKGFVCVSRQPNAEIKAKPVWSSTLIQDSEFQLDKINLLGLMCAFALAIRIYSSARRQQRRFPLSIEYKRSENPEIPRLSLPILQKLFLMSTLGCYNSRQTMGSAFALHRAINSISFAVNNLISPENPSFIIFPSWPRLVNPLPGSQSVTAPVIENPHPGIGAAAEDDEKPDENNVSANTQQDSGAETGQTESSAGLHRFGVTACNCLRRFFGPAQSPGFGSK